MNSSLALLGLLSLEPSYGYVLKHSYDRYFSKHRPLAFGQVYAVLSRMSRDDLITEIGEEAGGGPDRKKYEITTAGRGVVKDWLFTPDIPSKDLRSELVTKTVLALLLDIDAEQLLDAQRFEHMNRMRVLTKLQRDGDLLQVLMYDYSLFHMEADLRWIDFTSARLTQLKQELRNP